MFKRYLKKFCLFSLTALLVGALLTGCGPFRSSPPPEPPPPGEELSLQLSLYFPAPDGDGLIPLERTVTVPDLDVAPALLTGLEIIPALFAELANPPEGLENPLPEGTVLLEAAVDEEGLAAVNLSADFGENFNGGTAGEEMTLYSIVNTLTALPDVDSVQFLIEGQVEISILGHLDTSVPFERKESLIVE